MIQDIAWQGDHEGHLVLDSGTESERSIDRPGDIVTAIMGGQFETERRSCVGAVYGVCLAMRGVRRPEFMLQVVEKAITFLAGSDPQSLQLYKVMNDLRVRARESSGWELRDLMHAEAERLHGEMW